VLSDGEGYSWRGLVKEKEWIDKSIAQEGVLCTAGGGCDSVGAPP